MAHRYTQRCMYTPMQEGMQAQQIEAQLPRLLVEIKVMFHSARKFAWLEFTAYSPEHVSIS